MPDSKEKMTSRERVHAAAKGLPMDRAPVFYWLNAHEGAKLIARQGWPGNPGVSLAAKTLWNRFEKKGSGEAPDIWRFLPLLFDVHSYNWANAWTLDQGGDLLLASFATPWKYAAFRLEKGRILARDLWGVNRALGGGIYPDMVEPVIKTKQDLVDYRLPDPNDDRLYNVFRKYRKKYPHVSIAAEVWGAQDFTATSMFGMERFMLFLMDHPKEMKAFLEKWIDFNVTVARKSVEAGADVVFILDDYGYDNRTLISMKMWKEFTLPGLERLVEASHQAGALAALHSCGFQMPFLSYYTDLGIDMLQAFQPKAGNDFSRAYDEFGDKLTFITGIDIQQGEFMTPGEFRDSILESYQEGRKKNRHILGTSHEVQYTMPDANVRAMFDTVKEIQAGRHG